MQKATHSQMIERRKRMIQYNKTGMRPKEWVPRVATEFGVSEGAIRKDWKKKRSWKRDMVNLKEGEKLIRECIAEIQDSSKQLIEFIETTKNDNCKLGAIRLYNESRFKLMNFYNSYTKDRLRERIEKLEKEKMNIRSSENNDVSSEINLDEFNQRAIFAIAEIMKRELMDEIHQLIRDRKMQETEEVIDKPG